MYDEYGGDAMKLTIKQLRKRQGITQKEMADKLKISLYSYQKIERYPAKSEIKQLLAIANELHVMITDIFLFNNIANSNVEERNQDMDEKENAERKGGKRKC